MKIYRAWINQPSTQQPLHKLHGRRCIVHDNIEDTYVTLYFTTGKVHSMIADRLSISEIYLSAADVTHHK